MRRVNGAHEGVQTGGDWGISGGQGISGAIGVGIRAGSTGNAMLMKKRDRHSTAEDREAEEGIGKPGSGDSESRRKGLQEGGICRARCLSTYVHACVCLCVLKASCCGPAF